MLSLFGVCLAGPALAADKAVRELPCSSIEVLDEQMPEIIRFWASGDQASAGTVKDTCELLVDQSTIARCPVSQQTVDLCNRVLPILL